jgi:ParB family chromosome partitioning protein
MEKIKIEELKFAEYNPRKISEKEKENLKKSIKEFGLVNPIIINNNEERKNIVISGHQRITVAKEIGIKEVPIIKVDLNETREKILNIALNKISGEFDEDKLISTLETINDENEDSLGYTGFSTEELNYLLGINDGKKIIFAKEIEDYNRDENEHGIQTGDIIEIDGHKIICGDSSKIETFEKLLKGKKIDLTITSPPYNIKIDYGKYSNDKKYNEYLEMINEVFLNIKEYMTNGIQGKYICINIGREWGPYNLQADYHTLLKRQDYSFFKNIYWVKPFGSARGNPMSNPFPRYYSPKTQTEIIQVYSTENIPKNYEQMLLYKTSNEIDKKKQEKIPEMLLSKYAGNVWEMNTEGHLKGKHPAPFPVQLPFNCVRFFSYEHERVLDPFAGSCTTMIAADQLNRKFYGIEIDPKYISVAINRYKMYKPNAQFKIIK